MLLEACNLLSMQAAGFYCPLLPISIAHVVISAKQGLSVQVWRRYEDFLAELSARFPHEAAGIKSFYDECWAVFNALNSLELKSLEEPRQALHLVAQKDSSQQQL